MSTKLKFSLNGIEVSPSYDSSFSKEYVQASGQKYFREELNGSLTFYRDQYQYIYDQPFETQFILLISISYDGGVTWDPYFSGKFYKTQCDWNDFDKKVEVTPEPYDNYVEILSGLDKEYNLARLPLAKQTVTISKRPIIQMYIPGDTTIGCFLSGVSWEQPVIEPTADSATIEGYGFAVASTVSDIVVTGSGTPQECLGTYVGEYSTPGGSALGTTWTRQDGKYRIEIEVLGGGAVYLYIYAGSEVTPLFISDAYSGATVVDGLTVNFTANASNPDASGTLSGAFSAVDVYGRILTDAATVDGSATDDLLTVDITAENNNYSKTAPYDVDCVTISANSSDDPTEYGQAEDGTYYLPIESDTVKYYPLGRSNWESTSFWFNFNEFSDTIESDGRVEYTMGDASMLSDVIRVLLDQIDPTIKHEGLPQYSAFMYSAENPISGDAFYLALTQKSNILAGEYDQPAKRAPLTLGQVLNMLRDTFKLYWYITDDKKLRIEHISWFRNGGAYTDNTFLNIDLTSQLNPKTHLSWGYSTNRWNYDREDMPERFEFEWMDESSTGFGGFPIDMVSQYILKGKVEKVQIANFSPDIDFMLGNPEESSKDGFALMGLINGASGYELPFVTLEIEDADLELQNGYISWPYIHDNFWIDDLPAGIANVNLVNRRILNEKKVKKHTVSFPLSNEIDPVKLVKTELGNGEIEKISVNLSSMMYTVDLKYKPGRYV